VAPLFNHRKKDNTIQMPQTWVPALLEAHQLLAHLETAPTSRAICGHAGVVSRLSTAVPEVGGLSRPSQQVRGAH
jgi:hypothetical protein